MQEFNISQIPKDERAAYAMVLMKVVDEHSNKYMLKDAQILLEAAWNEHCRLRAKNKLEMGA